MLKRNSDDLMILFIVTGNAAVQPFITVYVKQLGFSSTVVGTVYGILPLLGLLSKLGVGAIADRLLLRRNLFLSFLLLATISYFLVQFVPDVKTTERQHVRLDCGTQTNIQLCSNQTASQHCIANLLANSYGDQRTIQCQFRCQINSQLCAAWRMPLCAIPSSNLSWMEFIGDISMEHTELLGDCMYFRISGVRLPQELGGTQHVPVCNSINESQKLQPLTSTCIAQCAGAPGVDMLLQNVTTVEGSVAVRTYQFWLLLFLLIASWVGMAVVVSLSDTICFEVLGERAHLYGWQRLWGSLGWGVLAFVSGLLVDHFSEGGSTEKNYTSSFYLLLTFWVLDFLCCLRLPHDSHVVPRSIAADIGNLILNPEILSFLLGCAIVGMCTGLQWNFLYWYLEDISAVEGNCDKLSWMKTLQGLVSGVQCLLGELPYFFVSGFVISKLGHSHCLSLVLGLIAVRFFLYSVLTNAWLTLPIELFQGAYGLFYPTMASFANAVASPGTEATVQGLLGAVFEGIGVALGSLVSGIAYEKYSGATTFRIFGCLALVTSICHLGSHLYLRRTRSADGIRQHKGFARVSSNIDGVAMLQGT